MFCNTFTYLNPSVNCSWMHRIFPPFIFITSPPKNGIHFYLIGSLMPNKLFKKLNNVWLWSDKLTPVLLFKNCSANISWMSPVFETLLDCLVKSNSTRRKVWVSLHRKRALFVCTGGANPLTEKEFFQVLAPTTSCISTVAGPGENDWDTLRPHRSFILFPF